MLNRDSSDYKLANEAVLDTSIDDTVLSFPHSIPIFENSANPNKT